MGNARRKSGPVASLQHDRLSPASLSTQTEISRASLSEHPECTSMSYRWRGRNSHISEVGYIVADYGWRACDEGKRHRAINLAMSAPSQNKTEPANNKKPATANQAGG